MKVSYDAERYGMHGGAPVLEVPCAGGVLAVFQAGDQGSYDEVEIDFVRDSDGMAVQCAVVGTDTSGDGSLHVYAYDGGEDVATTTFVDKATSCAYPVG